MMETIRAECESGNLQTHLIQKMRLTRDGLQEAHEIIETNATGGKIGMGVGKR